MGQVLIIKNNNKEPKIYQFAQESYMTGEERYYYATPDSLNGQYVMTDGYALQEYEKLK